MGIYQIELKVSASSMLVFAISHSIYQIELKVSRTMKPWCTGLTSIYQIELKAFFISIAPKKRVKVSIK